MGTLKMKLLFQKERLFYFYHLERNEKNEAMECISSQNELSALPVLALNNLRS